MHANHFLPLAVLALAACARQAPEPWERPDHTQPTVADTSLCHNEARTQAGTLYSGGSPNTAFGGYPGDSDPGRFPAEIGFYDRCMTRLGYVQVGASRA